MQLAAVHYRIASLVAVAVAFGISGCTDEKIVFRDRELFRPVEGAAAGFVGYTDEADKLTVCGNCHVGQQGRWEQTAHASAWEGLQASGSAQTFCEGCHSVSSMGNLADGEAGYTAVNDSRYHDVQCESCHGPGLSHVQVPDDTQPLASLAVGVDLGSGCGECHQGAHQPFVEEWAQSGHGTVVASPAGNPSCSGCHAGEDVLRAWGVQADYIEKADLDAPGQHLAITCAVCHDPHDATNRGQLRFPVDVANEEQNLCMKCHHKRGVPDVTTFRGPHSPEGPVLLGYGGWWPPNMEFPGGVVRATHGSEANPRLCAGCHVNSFTVTDPLTGDFVMRATGHLFEPIPCLDPQGIPTTGDCELSQRTFQSCTAAGCHGSQDVARGLLLNARNRLMALSGELDALLERVEPNWNTCRNNNRCPAGSPFNSADGVYTTAEGAAFNWELAQRPGSTIHNPFLLEALLTSTIRQVREDYGLSAVSGITLEAVLGR